MNLHRVYKGEFGYIKYRKNAAILRTIISLVITVGIYVAGLLIYGSQKNIMSIIAALGCLPAGWSAVNMIMFLKAKGCLEADRDKIEKCRGGLLIHYDHVITSYDKNFYVSASTVLDKNICCYSSDEDIEAVEVAESMGE